MNTLQKLLREPLVYFLVAGAALFAVSGGFGDDDAHRIVVSDAETARLADQWRAQMGRPPTATELEALIEEWIREEIYYREALAMGLDDNDIIIRRRLAQKLTFLTEDLATGAPPEEQALRDYHAANAERYAEPERYTFSHRYFSSERRPAAEADARAALAALAADSAGNIASDPFMLQSHYVERSEREIGELFGREFAESVAALPEGGWQGPVRSAYGWHLVKVEARLPARQLAFDTVSQRVAADYQQERREQASQEYYQALRARYEIVRP